MLSFARLVLTGALLLTGVASCSGQGAAQGVAPIVIGVGSTTEQRVLAALTVAALEDAGLRTEIEPELGSTIGLRRAALRGTVDLFWDYTGAAWALGLGNPAPPADPNESFERVRRADQDNELVWLEPSSANATLALFVRAADRPPEPEPRGMDWLAGVLSAGGVSLCADPDFIERPGGLEALAGAYAVDLRSLEVLAAGEEEAVEAVSAGRCFAGLANATHGGAQLAGLEPVTDDLMVFPAFIVAPVASRAAVESSPQIIAPLMEIVERLDTRALATLNAAAEAGTPPDDLAAEFFTGQG